MRSFFIKISLFSLCIQPAKVLSANLEAYENKLTTTLTTQNISSSFPKNYETSKERFLGYHRLFEKNSVPVLNLSAPINNKQNENLTIDGLYIVGEDNKKLLVLTSGIHGAEAFAGSALQDFFAQYLLINKKPKVSVLLLHALNPHGFKYFRRANSNNVDLNRNHANRAEFASDNKVFEKMVDLYTPETAASTGIIPQVGFYISVFVKYITAGKKIILNSLSGQYKYPKTVFYGGSAPEKETLVVQEWITTFTKNKTHILHIDLHTGFGEKAKLHFYGSDDYNSPNQIKNVQIIFPKASIDTAKDADFYPTKGDFVDWNWKSKPHQVVIPMVFEFGTLNSQKLSGALRSLWTTILENQAYHYNFATKSDAKIIRKRFEELFNPQDQIWQKKVYEQGSHELVSAYEKLSEI